MTRFFDRYYPRSSIVEQMKARAALYQGMGPLSPDSPGAMDLIDRCRAEYRQRGLTTCLIFTMDEGMHSIGWWKNPDYERCWHLTLSYWYPNGTVAPHQPRESHEWVEMFFYPHAEWVWTEPPHSEPGKRKNVWHYRLFADAGWQPIFPQGEVYSRLRTEAGWRSFSEVREEERKKTEERQQ